MKKNPAAPPAPAQTWRIGRTVPWVAPWSGEAEFWLGDSVEFPGKVELVQETRPGVGAPVLDGMHVLRQRRGVLEHLCHVCGRPTTANDRYLFPVPTGLFVALDDGARRYASHMPPCHLACARLAQEACPHLKSTYAQPVAWPRDGGEMACETKAPPRMAELAATLPPGLQVVFSYFRVFGADFSREVTRLRAEAAQGTTAGG